MVQLWLGRNSLLPVAYVPLVETLLKRGWVVRVYPYYGNPYYWWYPVWPDPIAMTYSMMYIWLYWTWMMYFLELFKKMMEKGIPTPSP